MKYRKSIIILVIAIFLFTIAAAGAGDVDDAMAASEDTNQMELSANDEISKDNLQISDNDELKLTENYELVGAQAGTGVLGAEDESTYSELSREIAQSGNITLAHKNYVYDNTVSIVINEADKVIDGNGAVIDMTGAPVRAFRVAASDVTIKNMAFINAKSDNFYGGAVYFGEFGTLINCNFTNNFASVNGGAVHFSGSGSVIDCNFIDNSASSEGGAVYFNMEGNVTNSNFINNSASNNAGAVGLSSGKIENCNFTNNKANEGDGGAIEFDTYGSVINCYFADNSASNADDIYSLLESTADTCIFKSGSNTTYNVRILPPTLNVDNVTVEVGEKLTFDLKTNGGMPVDNGNISIGIYNKTDGEWIGNYSCLSGEGWTVNLPVGQYNAVYGTQYLGFTPVNGTITVPPSNTFWALNNTINGNNNSVIELSHDYYFDSDYDSAFMAGIVIKRAVTIKGNGNTIDAKNQARVFDVRENGTVIDLTIKNGYYNARGGAIYFKKSCTVANCTFINNTVTGDWGYDGGALYFDSISEVTNCTFVNNSAIGEWGYGGAVNFDKSGTVTNCNFYNNSASGDMGSGGGVYFHYNGTVTNCNFINNMATLEGGGIDFDFHYYSGTVTNCTFTDNRAEDGGAVYFYWNGRVTNCTFNNNSAEDGGAVYTLREGTIKNCSFTDNAASEHGGALSLFNGAVSDCNFIGNNAPLGSVMFLNHGPFHISNSLLLNNRANANLQVTENENIITIVLKGNDNLLNAIYSDTNDISFTNVTYWGANGINNTGSSEIKVSRSNNEVGQNITIEIYDNNDNVVENVTVVTGESGQIKYDCIKLNNGNYTYKIYHPEDYYYTYCEKTGEFKVNSDLGDFNRLQSYINGSDANSVLTLIRNYTFTIGKDENLTDGIVIDKPITINGNGHTIDAKGLARIFNATSNVVFENITFKNAYTTSKGGAILMSAGGVKNCNFTDNKANGSESEGGAVYFVNAGEVTNCNFTNNFATYHGGAVKFKGAGDVTNSNFANNEINHYFGNGGAISIASGTVANCSFANNKANDQGFGGAVCFSGSKGNVTDCNFVNNYAYDGGGVFFWDGGSVTNCNFTANSASDRSGAIGIFDNGAVSDSTFVNNTASVQGGAIMFYDNGNLANSTFIGNKLTGQYSYGGAVFFNKAGSATDCNFVNNTAVYHGGAFEINGVGTASNCSFTGNSAGTGGAIVWKGSNGKISGNVFVNNSASDGIIYFNNEYSASNLSINDNIILNNNGVAISFFKSDSASNVDYNWFGNNATNYDVKPATNKVTVNIWLFLNATIESDPVVVFEPSDILFKLYSYGIIRISDYDNDQLYPVNLTVTAITGNIDAHAKLGESVTYNATRVGNDSVTAKIENTEYTIEITDIKISPNLSVGSQEVIYSNNTSINISYNSTATGKVNITLNGKKFDYEFTDIELNETISLGDIGADEYEVTVNYSGEGNFINSNATGNLTVNKTNSTISAINVEFNQEGYVIVTVISEGDNGITANIDEGEVKILNNVILISNLNDGNHTLTVTTIPDENHYAVNKSINIYTGSIKGNTYIDLEVLIVENNATFTVNVNPNATGIVRLEISGTENSTLYAEVKDGKAVLEDVLTIGNYSVVVTYLGDDNYNSNSTVIDFTVNKTNAIISANNLVMDYKDGSSWTVNLTDDKGNAIENAIITIGIDGKVYNVKTDENGVASLTIDLDAGTYKANASFSDDTHVEAFAEATIKVARTNPDISVFADNIEYGEDLVVNVTLSGDVSRRAIVTVDNETKYVSLTNGKGSIKFTGLTVGTHTIVASYNGDVNFIKSSANSTVKVNRGTTDIKVSAMAYGYGKDVIVDVVLPDDVSRRAIVTIGNETKLVSLKEGKGSVKFSGLAVGTYTVVAAYNGDVNYDKGSASTNIVVAKAASDIKVTANPVGYGEDVVVEVVLPSDVSRRAVVTLGNETKYVSLVDGVGSVKFSGLAIGSYDVVASYNGDENYVKSSTSAVAKVNKAVPEILVSTGDINVGETLVVDVQLPSDVTKRATVTIGNESKFVSLKEGIGSVKFTGLEAGTHDVVVSYVGDSNYKASSSTTTINVKN